MNPPSKNASIFNLVQLQAFRDCSSGYDEQEPPSAIPDLTNTLWEGVAQKILIAPVSLLNLSKVENTLISGGLQTVGEVMEWASNDYSPSLRGFGKGKRELLEEALGRMRTLSPEDLEPPDLHPSIAAIPTEGFHFGSRAESLARSAVQIFFCKSD